MRILQFHRKKRFVGCLMPYWIISNISKEELMVRVREFEETSHKKEGQGMLYMDFSTLGVQIVNGQTLEIAMPEEVASFFVLSRSGMSEEIPLEPDGESFCFEIDTKGGVKVPGYPCVYRK